MKTIKDVKDVVPAYRITNTDRFQKYQITKEVIVDPFRNTILQHIVFEQKDPNLPLRIFALLAPHLKNEGCNNIAWLGNYKEGRYVFLPRTGI
ncbi:hypothetical protein [Maribacter aquivivus]|uniref:hypothetical protein n=1 Tax=Maribacter aquivivus TaxID=228958 RepID=UPI0031E5A05A